MRRAAGNSGGKMPRFGSAIALVLASCASTPRSQPTAVPQNLRVPDGQSLLLRAAARGAQIYACRVKAADPAAFEWALKAPEAELFDQSRSEERRVGKECRSRWAGCQEKRKQG